MIESDRPESKSAMTSGEELHTAKTSQGLQRQSRSSMLGRERLVYLPHRRLRSMLDLLRDRGHDQARRKAADIEVNVLIKRYGDAETALLRCDEIINRHDDPSKLRFLRLVRERLVAIAAS